MGKEIKQKSVLVVDDDEALTRTIANLLRIEGYEVSTAYNGIQGYASYFRQRASEERAAAMKCPHPSARRSHLEWPGVTTRRRMRSNY